MSDEIKGLGFVFRDKRGSQQPDEDVKHETARGKDEPGPEEKSSKDFQIDFSTLILSLTSSAFYHLGDMPDPKSGEKKVDLAAVKQTIDILIMLKEKTKGNLNEDEKRLMEQLIYELQMKYMDHGKK